MRGWLNICSGLIVWTAHFFALYGIASVLPGQPLAAWLVLAATVVALAVIAWITRGMVRRQRVETEDFARWMANLGLLGLALAAVAIAYQGLIILF